MIDSNRWLDTLPNKKINFDQEYHRINSEKLINTFPKKDTNSVMKKYSVLTILFVAGLILVSIIKNETRELQREINNLKASIRILSLDLHQETLDHEVITSPENISNLAKEYLEYDLNYYKISQIGELNK